jgi:hypothetical protein
MTSTPEATEPDAAPLKVTVIPLAVPAAGTLEPPVPPAVVAPSAHADADAAAAADQAPDVHPSGARHPGQKRARQPLRDPWTYASVGTFIAVFATVFDALLVTPGSATTRLHVAGGIAAAGGILVVVASALILRRRVRRSTREPV